MYIATLAIAKLHVVLKVRKKKRNKKRSDTAKMCFLRDVA
jgi:hypothetical protein